MLPCDSPLPLRREHTLHQRAREQVVSDGLSVYARAGVAVYAWLLISFGARRSRALMCPDATPIPKKKSPFAELKRGTLCGSGRSSFTCPPAPQWRRSMAESQKLFASISRMRISRSNRSTCDAKLRCPLYSTTCAKKPRVNAGFVYREMQVLRELEAWFTVESAELYNPTPCRHSSVGRATAL